LSDPPPATPGCARRACPYILAEPQPKQYRRGPQAVLTEDGPGPCRGTNVAATTLTAAATAPTFKDVPSTYWAYREIQIRRQEYREGKILLEKRGNEPSKGKWTIPGGLVDLGESIEQAVVRETMEETCLEVENPRLIDVVDNVDLDDAGKVKYHFVIVDYVVKIKGGTVEAASDAEELSWVALGDVEAYDLSRSFRLFFRRNRHKLERL
jgi:8-oxo-dGTP diphosphatase